ncbi:hypothetical protein F4782DRAFT_475635 [Xylaria castorea]|nr:hypothetical protein F4782DRAFT_475635 [Xylaria castorea]
MAMDFLIFSWDAVLWPLLLCSTSFGSFDMRPNQLPSQCCLLPCVRRCVAVSIVPFKDNCSASSIQSFSFSFDQYLDRRTLCMCYEIVQW